MENQELLFRQVKALEDIADYLRRIDGIMQVMVSDGQEVRRDIDERTLQILSSIAKTMERIEVNTQP